MPSPIEEALGVLGMFVVRVGLPLTITFGIGAWAERKFRLSAQVEETARLAQAVLARRSKIIPMQCWAIKHCQDSTCPAFMHPELPCWEATEIAGGTVRDECL